MRALLAVSLAIASFSLSFPSIGLGQQADRIGTFKQIEGGLQIPHVI